MRRLLLLVLGSLALVVWKPAVARGTERLTIRATRVTGVIRLDGALDEPEWERAPPITALRLIEVREGEAPSESTDVRVLIDGTHVFFGLRCWNREAGAVRASLSPRDQILDDDHIAVHLDTYRDLHRAYIFGVNPFGVQLDGILDGQEPDFGWDAVWDAEATRDSLGWSAELAIPVKSLRFPSRGPGVWGLWIRRQITKNDEVCSWPLYRLGESGDIMLQAGDLEGMGELRGGGGLEVQPYAASTRGESRGLSAAGGLERWSGRTDSDVGLDVKYGITSTLTANATVNPDYSQVEADALQIDVNQRFPLFYPEKRPFFLEGAEVFNTVYRLVHTRRIADPSVGGKLTGKLGRWRVGAIGVLDHGGGSTEGIGARADGEPGRAGSFAIGRATCEIGENSSIGFLATGHAAEGTGGPVPAVVGFRAPGRSVNGVLALDARLRLARSLFASALLARSSTRADSVTEDGEFEGPWFSDDLTALALWWNDGKRYAMVAQDYLGSDFRADAGFLERVDVRISGYEAQVTFRPENRWIRYLEPATDGSYTSDTRGTLQERKLSGALRWGFQGQTFLETRVAHVDERWQSRLYDRWRYIVSVSNSLWRPLSLGLDLGWEDGIYYAETDSASYLGWLETASFTATARPSPRLTSKIGVARNRFARSRGGSEVYDVWVLGANTTYQFTRRLYARLYPQLDTHEEHLDLDALLGYVVHPGSVVYLGTTHDLDKIGGDHRATQRSVFVKASYALQR